MKVQRYRVPTGAINYLIPDKRGDWCPWETVKKLRADKAELLSMCKDLLDAGDFYTGMAGMAASERAGALVACMEEVLDA